MWNGGRWRWLWGCNSHIEPWNWCESHILDRVTLCRVTLRHSAAGVDQQLTEWWDVAHQVVRHVAPSNPCVARLSALRCAVPWQHSFGPVLARQDLVNVQRKRKVATSHIGTLRGAWSHTEASMQDVTKRVQEREGLIPNSAVGRLFQAWCVAGVLLECQACCMQRPRRFVWDSGVTQCLPNQKHILERFVQKIVDFPLK